MNEHALQVLEFPQVIEILAGFASSGLGQRQVRALQPATDITRVECLQAETTELKALLMPEQDLPIGGLHDLSAMLQQLDQGAEVLLIEQIMEVADTLRAARRVLVYLRNGEVEHPHLARMADGIGVFTGLEERIDVTFNENGGIKNSASERLKTARNDIQTLRGRIRGKLSTLMRSPDVAPHLQDTGIRDHDGRPTLAIRASASSRVRGAQRGRSDTGGTIFIEPEGVRKMGDELVAVLAAEKTEMVRILRDVTAVIAGETTQLRTTLTAMAHVDMTLAKVRMSRNFAMQPPRLNAAGVIRLMGARHPLLVDLQRRGGIAAVTPIDVRLGDDFHTLIITGPNTGGKTVALKTIGLLTLMAMAGMHVPAAAGSDLPVLQDVWADIGDEQSIEQSLSTFSSHLTQIGHVQHGADEHSLVLLDELGGGTDPAEGAALARSILEHLHEKGVRTAVTTHISELKTLAYTLAGVENASIEFDGETLQPTHRVLLGMAGSSNALALARRLGLPESVIDRAEAHRQGDQSAALLNELQTARVQTHADREQVLVLREAARQQQEETQRLLEETRSRHEQAKISNGEAAYDTLRQLQAQIEGLRQQEPSRRSMLLELGVMVRVVEQELERAPDVAPSLRLKVGDRVHVRSLGRVGVLRKIDTRTGKAVVEVGATPVTVDLDQVEGT